MTRFFDRIFQYRQSEWRAPRENYLTEILAAILEKHKKLAAAFVEYLLADRDDIQHGDIYRVDIETQRRFCGLQPDIYVTAHDSVGRHILIIENKIDAPEGENQLASYMELLEKKGQNANSRTLVYITQYSGSDFDGELKQFKHLYWHEVYTWIKNWVEESYNQEANSVELVTELLNLMEDWKMDGELMAQDLRAALIYHTSSGNLLRNIMEQAWNESKIEEDLKIKLAGKSEDTYFYCWRYSKEISHLEIRRIRMGYWFNREDSKWNAAQLELPSAVVAIYHDKNLPSAKLERPSNAWTDDPKYTDYADYTGDKCLWVKVLNETPCYGTSLSDFYRKFFLGALSELKCALHRTQNSTA